MRFRFESTREESFQKYMCERSFQKCTWEVLFQSTREVSFQKHTCERLFQKFMCEKSF